MVLLLSENNYKIKLLKNGPGLLGVSKQLDQGLAGGMQMPGCFQAAKVISLT